MTEATTPQSPLADFIVAEVRRQTGETEIRALVEKKIAEIIARAVNDQFSYGDLHKQITAAVGETLKIGERLDLPAYGTMVMALLRTKLDEKIHDLISAKLASDMDEILRIAPKEAASSTASNTTPTPRFAMSDETASFTEDQLALMNSLHEAVYDALYSDALLALEVVLMELLCSGAKSKSEALAVAHAIGTSLSCNVDMRFDEIHDPVGKVVLQ